MIRETAWMQRTWLLVGDEGIEKLQRAHVLVAGLGGVGSYAAEMLARAGVGRLTIIDGDVVDPTNRNRQLPALSSTHFLPKVQVVAKRLMDINPELILHAHPIFIKDETCDQILSIRPYDFVIDAIDTVSPKVHLIRKSVELGLPIISSMGAAGKLDPSLVATGDLFDVTHCTLAFQIRKRLRRLGVESGVYAVYTTEKERRESMVRTDGQNNKKSFMGTISYLPAIFGCTAASVVLRTLLGEPNGIPVKSKKRIKADRKKKNEQKD